MKSVLALVAAIAMVLGAIAVRNRMDDKPTLGGEPTRMKLTCATELAAACEAMAADDLDVIVEPASDTAERLTGLPDGARAGLDGWLVPAPWPQIVAEARQRAGRTTVLAAPSAAIGRTPVVVVAWRERAAVLERSCKTPVGWRCIGDAARAQTWKTLGGNELWGPFKPFHADATREASGLVTAAAAAVSFLGRTDFSSADLDEDAFTDWYSELERSLPPTRSTGAAAVQETLATGPSVYDVVGAFESEAQPLVAASARRGELQVIYPSPMVTADAVLAGAARGGRIDDLARLVTGEEGRRSLADSGWRVEGRPTVGPPLPPGNGLPSPGALEALRLKTKEIR
ncbi:MAG TPA: substrate-binding domain-containing protein [Acidimicrobiales bacterium]|nr:substrate-binding domain-containing protein [Acidimicrobiales bacterium]